MMSHLYDIYHDRGGTMIPTEFVPKWVHPVLGWISAMFGGSVVIQAAMTPSTFQAWSAAVIGVLTLAFNAFLLCYNRWMKRAERKEMLQRLSDDDITIKPRGSNMRGEQK